MNTGNASTALLPEQRLADLSALVRVLAQINRSLDPEDVFESSLKGIQGVVGGDYGCFLLFQPDAPTLQLVCASGLPASLREQLQLLTLAPELVTGIAKPENLVETFAALGQQVLQVLEVQGITSFILLPLTTRGRAVGILLVGVGVGRLLPPLSIDLLMAIGEQVGMAIENARLHASLAASEAWRRAFMENSPDGFWESDALGRVVYVNPSACKILGYSREEILQMRREDFLTIDEAALETLLTGLYQAGALTNQSIKIRVKSGEIRTINYSMGVVRDSQGNVIRRPAIFRDVTEQQQVLDTLRQRNQELAALNAIANVLSSPLELAPSLDQVCEQIATITGMETVTIHLTDESRGFLSLAACRGMSDDLRQQVIQLGLDDPAARGVAVEGQSVAFNDVTAYTGVGFAGPRAEGYHAGIGVPILQRGSPIGSLFVGSQTQTCYEPSDVALLLNIGSQIGIALENARLYTQMQQRVRELDGLAQLSAACAASLDPQAICNLAVEWTQKLLQVPACSIRFIEQGQLRLGAVRGQREAVGVPELLDISAVSRSIFERRIPHPMNDLETDPSQSPVVRQLVREHGMRASVAAPLLARNQVIGILGVADEKPHQWSPQERDLLQTIANQVANAIDNAQLYQNALNERRKVQAIFDSGLSGLYATDATGKIMMFNRAAERITGWTLAEVRGQHWADLLSDRAVGNLLEPLLDEALIHKKTAYVPEGRKMRTRDGRVIPVAKAVAPLLDEKENVIGAVGAFWDLSKEQRAEIEYENLLAMVAHQLRSPLTSVLSALELFERRNLPDARRAELWAIIKTEGNQLKKLADQFLEHQAAAKSSRPVQFEPLSVATLARQLVRQFQTAQSKHHFRIQVPNPEPLAFADTNRVEHVLRNLLDNAVSYSPAGSRIIVRIKPQDEDWVDVSVQDCGAGIPLAEQSQIFQPFYRVPQTSTRRIYGHGLGLALAKEMVDAMGGQIWVDSEPEHGATFHFTLRRAR